MFQSRSPKTHNTHTVKQSERDYDEEREWVEERERDNIV